MPQRIAIVTTTRADWGLLLNPARALSELAHVEVIAGNMHLDASHGHTIDQIRRDGFEPSALVPMDERGDSPYHRALAQAQALEGFARAFNRVGPDKIVVLGDRYEVLAAASAAAMMRIPLVHLHGGEVTRGAIDDSMRHAITKLASLHLTSTEQYRQRVIQMGEEPRFVINTGAIGVYNALNTPLLSASQLSADLNGFPIGQNTLVVTFHPATLDSSQSPEAQFAELLAAFDTLPELNIIITGANNDAGGSAINSLCTRWCTANSHRALMVQSLGMTRYLSAVKHCGAVVGNSSSGIIEVPSLGTPTVNIGMRQQGRIAAPSVINCNASATNIAAAIYSALQPAIQRKAENTINPYYHSDTLALITNAVLNLCPHSTMKTFHDLCY